MKRINKIYIAAVILLLVFLITTHAGATVRVEPARIIINTLAQSRSTGTIEVINKGEEAVELKAVLNDWSLNEEDALLFFNPGENNYSLAGLIKFNPRVFTLQPGKKQIVRFTINTPENPEKERRGVVFFEQETDYTAGETGSKVVTQIGTVIYLVPENIKYNFKFTGLRVYKTPPPEPQPVVLSVENAGTGHFRYYLSYKVVDSQNKLVMEEKFNNEFIILPEYKRKITFMLAERLKPGDYKLMLQFSFYNTDQTADYQIPIKIN